MNDLIAIMDEYSLPDDIDEKEWIHSIVRSHVNWSGGYISENLGKVLKNLYEIFVP